MNRPHILRPKKCRHEWAEPYNGGWRCHFCWKVLDISVAVLDLPTITPAPQDRVQ